VVSWAAESYLTRGLTIHVDTSRFDGSEEIDAIELLGSTVLAVPEPGRWALMAAGIGWVLARRRNAGVQTH
jgi:hypothetical protein